MKSSACKHLRGTFRENSSHAHILAVRSVNKRPPAVLEHRSGVYTHEDLLSESPEC